MGSVLEAPLNNSSPQIARLEGQGTAAASGATATLTDTHEEPPSTHPWEGSMQRRILYQLTWLAAAMSLGHHLDHLIRHNAVGWPLTEEVNAFTASLVVYPIIATGLVLYHAGRVGPGFWALVSGGGAAFVAVVHFGPAAAEPPALILDHYQPPVLGWLVFGWLVAFVAVLAITSMYETRMWAQQRQARRASRPATGVGSGR
jgi:hypothetical protein